MAVKTGLILGRFQGFHKGHEMLIRKACETCDRVLVLVGSAQIETPFTYDERRTMIRNVFPDIEIAPICDVGMDAHETFAQHVMDTCREAFGTTPDILIFGREDAHRKWIDGLDLPVLQIEKSIDIASSKLISAPNWQDFVSAANIPLLQKIFAK